MCDEEITNVKSRLLDLLVELDEVELGSVEQYISSQAYKKDLETKKKLLKSEKQLAKIGKAIIKCVPLNAEMPSENIVPPVVGDQADCNVINTCHVDEFLYDQSQVDDLVKRGKIKKHYCLDCNSRNIKDLTYISHSMSKQALHYVFKVLLPADLEGKQILDVGSRLGAVIYAAYYLTNASSIVGIEMNKECCELQENMVGQFFQDKDRIKVVHADVTDRSDIVENSNVIVINVLDFFVDVEKHKQMWYFFKNNIKKGSYLICNRSIAETLTDLEVFENFMDWLNICKPNQIENEIFFDIEECSELYLYTVN